MEVELTLKSWGESRKRDGLQYRRRVRLVKAAAAKIEELGSEFSFTYISNGKVRLTVGAENGTGARFYAARAREVLGVKQSTKELNTSSGMIDYTTENDKIVTVVRGGDVPANCHLVPKANSYITYQMVCNEEVVNA